MPAEETKPEMLRYEVVTVPALDAARPVPRFQPPAAPADTREAAVEATEPLLREFLDTFAPDAPTDAFAPDTAEKVDGVLGKVADARARAARIRENAEKMARACDAEAEGLEWRFGPALQAFARRELTGKKKSLRLFHGVIGYRTRPAGVSFTDPAAALAHAKAFLPAAVTETLDRKSLAAALLETGEAVDFAAFTPAEDMFYIK